MESETVVVGVQGKGEICGGMRDEAPKKPRGSRPVQHRPNHPGPSPHALPPTRPRTTVKCRNNSSSSSSSSVRTHLLAFRSIPNLGTAGESAVGKSRCLPLTRPPHPHTSETHPPLVWFSDSSKISLMITGKVPSEVRISRVFEPVHHRRISTHRSRILNPDRDARRSDDGQV